LTKDWECEIWDIPNVKSNHPEKTIHPCQFPIELVQRCILALTNKGDTVFDPFTGVASALIAAMIHDRQGVGFELDDEYISIANKRIYDFLNNNLKIRPLGKPVYKPTGREKVSQIPLSWVKNAA
jgi:adenine-specific DNA-methyltransferase